MKRRLLFIALVLAATLLVACAAYAETDPIVCSMEVTPAKLSGPGTVNVTITISNSGDTDMKDPLMLYNPVSELVADFGTDGSAVLKAGEVKTWTGTWDVNQRTLENGSVVFFVKYTLYKDSGEAYSQSQPIRGKISYATAEASVDIKRTITPGTAREGQTVTVKYDISNTGTVSLLNVTIKENKDINTKTQTIPELKPGETAQIKFPVTMGKKNLTSNATITYKTELNNKTQSEKVDDQVITFGEPAMSAILTSDVKGVAQGGTVKLTLDLKNSGNVEYSDLRVTDPKLGDVFTNQTLAKKGKLTLEKEITLTETTEYQFTITAIDDTGTEVSLSTDPLTLTAVDPNKVLHLTLEASSDKTEVYADPGVVRFSVKVTNDSEVDAKEVAVFEAGTKLYTFAAIPAGESRTLTRDATLSMSGKYLFNATAVDDLGSTLSFESNAIQIAFSAPTPAPATSTPVPEPTAEPTFQPMTPVPINDGSVGTLPKLVRSIVYPVTILSLVLMVGALVLLGIATKRRIDQKRASDAAYDHLERAKRRDYVAPGETEEPKPEAGEAESPEGASETGEDVELPHMKYVRDAYEHRDEYAKEAYGDGYASDEEDAQVYPDDAMYGMEETDVNAEDVSVRSDAYDDSMFRRPSAAATWEESPETREPSDASYADGENHSVDPYAPYDQPEGETGAPQRAPRRSHRRVGGTPPTDS